MSTTGAVNDHASAYPAGGRACSRSGTAEAHQGSSVRPGSTSVPGIIGTPEPSSLARPAKTR